LEISAYLWRVRRPSPIPLYRCSRKIFLQSSGAPTLSLLKCLHSPHFLQSVKAVNWKTLIYTIGCIVTIYMFDFLRLYVTKAQCEEALLHFLETWSTWILGHLSRLWIWAFDPKGDGWGRC
jgi:hypothetical protein